MVHRVTRSVRLTRGFQVLSISPLPLRRLLVRPVRWYRIQIVGQVDHTEIVAEVTLEANLSRR